MSACTNCSNEGRICFTCYDSDFAVKNERLRALAALHEDSLRLRADLARVTAERDVALSGRNDADGRAVRYFNEREVLTRERDEARAENASLHAKLERVTKAALTLTQTAWEGDLDEMVVDFTAFEMLCAALDDKDGAG